MTPDEYSAQQAAISAAIANYILHFAQFFARPALALADWLELLESLFPTVQQSRREAAVLARTFYDYQRGLNYPDLPRNDQFLEGYEFDEFVQEMEPARQRMSQEESPVDAVPFLALRVVREVENGGRRQIIHAVENESEPKSRVIRGWARVATGRETCAWCLMLVSRGPTYFDAGRAGLDIDEESAIEAFEKAADLETYFAEIGRHMEQWHDGCDCKAVPVFKTQSWFGEAAEKRALELWNDATKVAKKLQQLDPGRVHKAGKRKGKPFTLNELAINTLRQMLEDGEISTTEWAAISAA